MSKIFDEDIHGKGTMSNISDEDIQGKGVMDEGYSGTFSPSRACTIQGCVCVLNSSTYIIVFSFLE